MIGIVDIIIILVVVAVIAINAMFERHKLSKQLDAIEYSLEILMREYIKKEYGTRSGEKIVSASLTAEIVSEILDIPLCEMVDVMSAVPSVEVEIECKS